MSAPTRKTIDEFSVVVSPLQMSFNGTNLSLGTCFFWQADERVFLVTNWHNVSGKNPESGEHLSPTLAEPNRIEFDVWVNRDLNNRSSAGLDLIVNDRPIWFEHRTYRQGVDVVCIELPSEIGESVFPINARNFDPISYRVSDEVFILGYPMGIGVERLPIWKRASVASEIEIDVDGLPKLLVDTASASGMSGSPVIRRSTGGLLENGSVVLGTGTMTRLVGVYSGRLTTGNALDAQLGIVWKEHVINEIIHGRVRN